MRMVVLLLYTTQIERFWSQYQSLNERLAVTPHDSHARSISRPSVAYTFCSQRRILAHVLQV